MVLMPGDLLKHGARSLLFCSSLQFSLCYKTLLLQLTEASTSNACDHKDSGFKSEETRPAEMKQVFEIET